MIATTCTNRLFSKLRPATKGTYPKNNTPSFLLGLFILVLAFFCLPSKVGNTQTPPPPDTTPPSIIGVDVEVGNTSATISWNTDELTTGQLGYGQSTLYELGSEPNPSTLTSTVNFEDIAVPFNNDINAGDFSAGGYAFDINNDRSNFANGALFYQNEPYAYNGSTYLFIYAYYDNGWVDPITTLSHPNGKTFTLKQLNIAEVVLSIAAFTIEVTGLREDGSTVTKIITLDQVLDGEGPLEDFQTETFDNAWEGLTSVSLQALSGVSYAMFALEDIVLVENQQPALNHSQTLTNLIPDTDYHYQISATDVAGNVATSDDQVFHTNIPIDITPPLISAVDIEVGETTATISWTTEELASSIVTYGLSTLYELGSETDLVETFNHSLTLTGLTSDTDYHAQISAIDEAGNVATSSDWVFHTNVPIDTTIPFISAINVTMDDTSVTISWNTDELTTGQLGYGQSMLYELGSEPNPSALTSTVNFENIAVPFNNDIDAGDFSAGGYAFDINNDRSNFANGVLFYQNEPYAYNGSTYLFIHAYYDNGWVDPIITLSHPNDKTFTLKQLNIAEVVLSLAAFTIEVTGLREDGSTVTKIITLDQVLDGEGPLEDFQTETFDNAWEGLASVSLQAQSGASYAMFALEDIVLVENQQPALNHSQTLTGLVPDTDYHYQISATDVAGNVATSDDQVFHTNVPIDITPPLISAVDIEVDETTATISWTTEEPASSIVTYGLSTLYELGSGTDPVETLNHNLTLTGLTPNTTYYAQISATDGAGNVATSGDWVFHTNTPIDITTPSISAINVTVGDTFATISWNTDEPTFGQLGYGQSTLYELGLVPDPSTLTSTINFEDIAVPFNNDIDAGDFSSGGYAFDINNDLSNFANGALYYQNEPYAYNASTYLFIQAYYGSSWVDPIVSLNPPLGQSFTLNQLDITEAFLNYPAFTVEVTGWHEDGSSVTKMITLDQILDGSGPLEDFQTETFDSTWQDLTSADFQVASGTSYAMFALDNVELVAQQLPALNHSLMLTGLIPDMDYHYQIRATDVAGNITISGDRILHTSVSTDVTPPLISAVDIEVNETSATISWTTEEPASSIVVYGLNTLYDLGSETDPIKTFNHSLTLTGLTSDTDYHAQISATDEANNVATSGDWIFHTNALVAPPPPPDTTSPLINAIEVAADETSAIITWSTNEVANGQVAYGETSQYEQGIVENTQFDGVKTIDFEDILVPLDDAIRFEPPDGDFISGDFNFDIGHDQSNFANGELYFLGEPISFNGSTFFYHFGYYDSAWVYPPVTMSPTSNATFSLQKIEIAETITEFQASAYTVEITGLVQDGSVLSKTIVLDWIKDGTGPIEDFQTEVFDATWSNLNSVTFQAITGEREGEFALDNIVVVEGASFDHSILLTGLAPNTEYHYQVISVDLAGNMTTTEDQVFSTLATSP